jgi:hypothetical protein
MKFWRWAGALVACLLPMLSGVSRADEAIGAFLIIDSVPDTIFLKGDLGPNSPLDFRRALQARPRATTLMLDSNGGIVASGILVAQDVHARGMDTYIPPNGHCYSACSFIFLAGHTRIAQGELGVHQLSADIEDNSGMQYSLSDVIDNLVQFDTPPQLISRMLRTPSDKLYIFTADELKSLQINQVTTDVVPDEKGGLVSVDQGVPPETSQQPEEPSPLVANTAPAPLQTLASTRIAVYEGLDFYGADLSRGHASNIVECSKACLGDRSCRAFTFNADPNIKTGPNCFVKSGYDRLEAFKNALSGVVLRPGDGEPPTFTFSAIDPTVDIYTGVNIPSGTIGLGPVKGVNSLGECRMACLDDNQCAGFSYRSSTKQCWFKSDVSSATNTKGYSSAAKRSVTMGPSQVSSVDP